jgi:cobalamin synthase
MNTALSSQTEFSVNFHKWLYVTTFSVALSVFVTALLAAFFSPWSDSMGYILICLTTSFFSSLTQLAVIRDTLPIKNSHGFFGSLLGNVIGWAVSLLLVYPLIQLVDIPPLD